MYKIVLCVLAAIAASPKMIPEKGEDLIQIYFENPEIQDNRGPVIQLVDGEVDLATGLAILHFASPCGTVQYEMENLGDNSYVSGSVAGTGTAMIPFSCTIGHWRLTLTLASGEEFVGEFTI